MRNIVTALSLAALLTACGLKGPLYLPQQKPGAQAPSAIAPATPADEKKSPDTVSP